MKIDRDTAKTLLSIPKDDFHEFIREAVQTKRLHGMVQALNEQCLSKTDANAAPARAALTRIGFID